MGHRTRLGLRPLGPCLLLLVLSPLIPRASSGGLVTKASAGALSAAVAAQKGKAASKVPVPAKKSPGVAAKKPPGKRLGAPPGKKTPDGKKGPKTSPPAATKQKPIPLSKSNAHAKMNKTAVPTSPPSPPPPPPPPPPSTTALRFKRLISNLEKRKEYSKYIDTVKSTQFSAYLETLVGYSLTFFVVPDPIWGQLKTTRTNLRLQLLKYHTTYNMYQKAELDRLPAGAKLVSTNNQMPIFKIAGGKFSGRSTDKDGAFIVTPAIYYNLDTQNGNWIVHVVSRVMNPASMKF